MAGGSAPFITTASEAVLALSLVARLPIPRCGGQAWGSWRVATRRVARLGMAAGVPMKHCCEDMRRHVEWVCDQHPDRSDCPDCLMDYNPRFQEYGLMIHDGGSSVLLIHFCPWCGSRLPVSIRDKVLGNDE